MLEQTEETGKITRRWIMIGNNLGDVDRLAFDFMKKTGGVGWCLEKFIGRTLERVQEPSFEMLVRSSPDDGWIRAFLIALPILVRQFGESTQKPLLPASLL
jgi:hypothetical protein